MNERAAFESAIDANPLEASNHLVYADWLDEHNEPDEAAFRRSMGNWHKSRFEQGYTEAPEDGNWTADVVADTPVNQKRFREGSTRHPLPNGVQAPPWTVNKRGNYYLSYSAARWPSYRDMESDFRDSFMAKRGILPGSTGKFSRRRMARLLSSKKPRG